MPVYIIRAGQNGPVKIGKADDPASRIRDLQTGHFEELVTLRVMDGGAKVEAAFHRQFEAKRIRGEWFEYCDEMLTFVPAAAQVKERETFPIFDKLGGKEAVYERLQSAGFARSIHALRMWEARASLPGDVVILLMMIAEELGEPIHSSDFLIGGRFIPRRVQEKEVEHA